jgi:hypothetical protein
MGTFLSFFSLLILFLNIPANASEKDSTDQLSAFSARIKDKLININWRITNPRDISYFEIQKHDGKTRLFKTINKENIKRSDFIEQGVDENNLTVYKYNYEDDPEKDGVYYYRIKAFSTGGKQLFISDEIKIGVNGLRDFSLEQNRPNPFNPSTSITYDLTSQTHVTLKVFDLLGREIATLVDQSQGEGEYTIEFDASKYSNLTSGIYFYKLETDKYSEVKKMILTK